MKYSTFFKRFSKRVKPDPEFRKRLWAKLETRAQELYPEVRSGFFARPIFRYALVPLVIILLCGFGTGVYAYESPSVNEEHPLYSLKRGIEDIEEQFYKKPESRAKFHLKKMRRRMAEAEALKRRGKLGEKTLKEIAEELDLSLKQVQAIRQTAKRQALLEALEKIDKRHLEHLEKLKERLPEESQKKLDRIIERQTEQLKKRLERLDEVRQREFVKNHLRRRQQMIKHFRLQKLPHNDLRMRVPLRTTH